MVTAEFRTMFGEVAKAHGFTGAHGGWYRDTGAALLILSLQKSNFGNYLYLNIKIFLGERATGAPEQLRQRIKNLNGDVFRRQSNEQSELLNLENDLSISARREGIDAMFRGLIGHMVACCEDTAGILRLGDEGLVFLLPSVKARLERDA